MSPISRLVLSPVSRLMEYDLPLFFALCLITCYFSSPDPAQVEERSVYLVVGEQLTLVCPGTDSYVDPVEDIEWSIDAKGAKKLEKGEWNGVKLFAT